MRFGGEAGVPGANGLGIGLVGSGSWQGLLARLSKMVPDPPVKHICEYVTMHNYSMFLC